MNNLNRNYYNTSFSYIYVEKDILSHPRTKKILQKFPKAHVIEIVHYKDVFCRKGQSTELQNQIPMLILAAKRPPFLYHGSPVCQNFNEDFFYYTSCVMNCLYDCDYCYLKGMYPSGNLVIFVNPEDIFSAVRESLKQHALYLCISYDTDLLALEDLTGFVEAWTKFAAVEKGLKIECRTKCGRTDLWKHFPVQKNVIFAFTLSPQDVICTYEHRASALEDRLKSIETALSLGFPVRLCFDPLLYVPDWKKSYGSLLSSVTARIDVRQLEDVSVGSFRISKDYLKQIRRVKPESAIVQFPFESEGGFYHYPKVLMDEMEHFLVEGLKRYLPDEKIFRWNNFF